MGFLKRVFGREQPGASPPALDLDALMIQQLAQAGADLRLSRETMHYLYVPTERAARLALQDLSVDGRKLEIRPAAEGTGWLVLLTQSMIVSPSAMAALRAEIEAVSGQHRGDYDGWEAAVRSD